MAVLHEISRIRTKLTQVIPASRITLSLNLNEEIMPLEAHDSTVSVTGSKIATNIFFAQPRSHKDKCSYLSQQLNRIKFKSLISHRCSITSIA